MKRASEEMLMFVRDVRVIYQSVLFGGFNSDEAVVGESELSADACLVFFPTKCKLLCQCVKFYLTCLWMDYTVDVSTDKTVLGGQR